MSDYYFLASLLPELAIGSPPELGFHELSKLLATNLTRCDLQKVKALRLLYDLENLRARWSNQPEEPYGNFDKAELEEAVLTQSGLPSYVYDFIDRYDENVDRLHHFSSLLASYFTQEIPRSSGFLKEYLTFEREWRLVAAAYRAKVLGRDLAIELQYEDPEDDLVRQILAQKDAPNFEAPARFDRLVSILETKHHAPMEMHRALCEYRFDFLERRVEGDFFGIDRILSYLAQLIIVEEWLQLDRQQGIEFIETILKEVP